jgi:sialic acid synthase SpsE
MKIGNRFVDYNTAPVVIVEIGINHEGSLQTAFEMVDAAADAGAEVIKHQTHIIEDEMSSEARNIIPGNAKVSVFEIMKRCALGFEEELELKRYVETKGMIFISTPFSRAAADRLEKMDIPAYKIGSGECNNYPLIKHIASFGKPIILSTGMNDVQSIRKSVEIMDNAGIHYALLHTTNIYPTPPELVRLNAITILRNEFPNTLVGLSDHTTSNYACLAAVALGATILERHFTDRMDRPGPDIVCSMDREQLADLILGAKTIQMERGGEKCAVPEEQPTINFAFASVVSITPIKKGEKFTSANIWVKRPGTGEYLADSYELILGQTATLDIASDVQIRKCHVLDA